MGNLEERVKKLEEKQNKLGLFKWVFTRWYFYLTSFICFFIMLPDLILNQDYYTYQYLIGYFLGSFSWPFIILTIVYYIKKKRSKRR